MTQEQQKMRDKFTTEVARYQDYVGHTDKAVELLDKLGLEDSVQEIHGVTDDYVERYLETIAEIMGISDTRDLINDEWFWGEWNSNTECFWFVYGLTALTRECVNVAKFNNERRKEEQEVLDKANELMKERL